MAKENKTAGGNKYVPGENKAVHIHVNRELKEEVKSKVTNDTTLNEFVVDLLTREIKAFKALSSKELDKEKTKIRNFEYKLREEDTKIIHVYVTPEQKEQMKSTASVAKTINKFLVYMLIKGLKSVPTAKKAEKDKKTKTKPNKTPQ